MFSRTALRVLCASCRIRFATQGLAFTRCSRLRISSTPATSRNFATPPPQIKHSTLSMERYHALSDTTMIILYESLEELIDAEGNLGYEIEYSSGVLTLKLGQRGTYVINKQPPNKQIWLSSPISGPKRYDYSEKKNAWIYSRNGELLQDLLHQELKQAFTQDVDLGLQDVSTQVA